MITSTRGGRHRSKLTLMEKRQDLARQWESMSEIEKAGVRHIIDEVDFLGTENDVGFETLAEMFSCSEVYHGIAGAHYVDRIASVEEFVLDNYYLGHVGKYLWPKWLADLQEVFAGRYTEVIVTGAIGSGKCLDGKTEFYDPVRGCRLVLKEVCARDDVHVVAFDQETNTTVTKKAKVRLSGEKYLGTLTLASGKVIRLSPDHPVLTENGWSPIGDITMGELIATARSVPAPDFCYDVSDEEVEFVAFLLAEKRGVLAEKREVGATENIGKTIFHPRGTRWVQHKYGLHETSHRKRIPPEFYGLSDEQLGLFLNRIWACDGSINIAAIATFEICLASELFIRDIQQLLLRFGIHSQLQKGEGSEDWQLTISGAENIGPLCAALGPVLGKESAWKEAAEWARVNQDNSNIELTRIGMDFESPERCSWWTGVFWDRVVSFDIDNEMSPVYDVEVPGLKNFAPHSVIVHNTTFSDIGIAYMFYELCMLRDPQATFGLMPGSEIVLVCFNRDKKLARDVTFGGLKRKLEVSPFFKELGCKFGGSELVYPDKNIRIIAVSVRSADALGRDVFGGVIDETEFMEGSILKGGGGVAAPGEKPFAELLHESITRRMKSRYERAGALPGKLFLSSSARHKQSFTNRRIASAANDPGIFCRDYAIYDVAPAERFSKKHFWVMVGTERIKHKIFHRREFRALGGEGRKQLEEKGCRFIKVPDNFRPDFERNIEDAIREIAGVVTVVLSPFIQMRDRIYDAIDPTLFHPMGSEVWRTDEATQIDWRRLVKLYERRVGPGRLVEELRPIRHPDATRHAHIDISLGASDPAGICIAHVVDTIDVERRTEGGREVVEQAPLIEVDLMLRILPPLNGEIDLGSIRALVYDFVKHGYNLTFVSMDLKFLSADTLQQFEHQGIDTEVISVDKTIQPYTYCKTALYEGRLSLYEYPIVLQELEQLQRDEIKQKVDHVPGGSKDVSDSLAGVVFSLSTKQAYRAPIMRGISEYEDHDKSSEWIRKTMHRTGEEAPQKVGDVPEDGKPIIFTG